MVLGLAASASPENLLQMQTWAPSQTFWFRNSGVGPAIYVLTSLPGHSDASSSWRTSVLDVPNITAANWWDLINEITWLKWNKIRDFYCTLSPMLVLVFCWRSNVIRGMLPLFWFWKKLYCWYYFLLKSLVDFTAIGDWTFLCGKVFKW